jgi:hypothetical protein
VPSLLVFLPSLFVCRNNILPPGFFIVSSRDAAEVSKMRHIEDMLSILVAKDSVNDSLLAKFNSLIDLTIFASPPKALFNSEVLSQLSSAIMQDSAINYMNCFNQNRLNSTHACKINACLAMLLDLQPLSS